MLPTNTSSETHVRGGKICGLRGKIWDQRIACRDLGSFLSPTAQPGPGAPFQEVRPDAVGYLLHRDLRDPGAGYGRRCDGCRCVRTSSFRTELKDITHLTNLIGIFCKRETNILQISSGSIMRFTHMFRSVCSTRSPAKRRGGLDNAASHCF